MNKNRILYLFLCFPFFASGQFSEVGIGLGGAVYYGDMSLDKAVDNFKMVRPNIGIFANQHLNERIAVQLGIQNFTLTGDDALNSRQGPRERNLNFRSNIWEIALRGEFYLIPFDPDKSKLPFSLYMSAGVAVFFHNPKAYYAGSYYALRPLSTEGQGLPSFPDRKPYSLTQIAFPVIGGLKYMVSKGVNVFIEFGPRFTLTDYIDDLSNSYAVENELRYYKGYIAVALSDRRLVNGSEPKRYPDNQQRGNPKSNDMYFTGLLGVSFNMNDFFGLELINKVKCPTF